MSGNAGAVFSDATEIGIVLRPQVVDSQHRLVISNFCYRDTKIVGSRGAQNRWSVSEPPYHHWLVPFGGWTQHGNPLTQFQMVVHGKGIQFRRHWTIFSIYDQCNLKLWRFFLPCTWRWPVWLELTPCLLVAVHEYDPLSFLVTLLMTRVPLSNTWSRRSVESCRWSLIKEKNTRSWII